MKQSAILVRKSSVV